MPTEKPLATLRANKLGDLLTYGLILLPGAALAALAFMMAARPVAEAIRLAGPFLGGAAAFAATAALASKRQKRFIPRLPKMPATSWVGWSAGTALAGLYFAWAAAEKSWPDVPRWLFAGVGSATLVGFLAAVGCAPLKEILAALPDKLGREWLLPRARLYRDRIEIKGAPYPFTELLSFEYCGDGSRESPLGLRVASPYASATVPLHDLYAADARRFVRALREAYPGTLGLQDPPSAGCEGRSAGYGWAMLVGLAATAAFLWWVGATQGGAPR